MPYSRDETWAFEFALAACLNVDSKKKKREKRAKELNPPWGDSEYISYITFLISGLGGMGWAFILRAAGRIEM